MASNYTLTNTTLDYNNQSGINFTMLCPIYSESDHFWKETIAFWLDGVIKTVVAIFGILTNILAAYILMKPKMDERQLFTLTRAPVILFHPDAMRTIVECWNWLLSARPDLELVFLQVCFPQI